MLLDKAHNVLANIEEKSKKLIAKNREHRRSLGTCTHSWLFKTMAEIMDVSVRIQGAINQETMEKIYVTTFNSMDVFSEITLPSDKFVQSVHGYLFIELRNEIRLALESFNRKNKGEYESKFSEDQIVLMKKLITAIDLVEEMFKLKCEYNDEYSVYSFTVDGAHPNNHALSRQGGDLVRAIHMNPWIAIRSVIVAFCNALAIEKKTARDVTRLVEAILIIEDLVVPGYKNLVYDLNSYIYHNIGVVHLLWRDGGKANHCFHGVVNVATGALISKSMHIYSACLEEARICLWSLAPAMAEFILSDSHVAWGRNVLTIAALLSSTPASCVMGITLSGPSITKEGTEQGVHPIACCGDMWSMAMTLEAIGRGNPAKRVATCLPCGSTSWGDGGDAFNFIVYSNDKLLLPDSPPKIDSLFFDSADPDLVIDRAKRRTSWQKVAEFVGSRSVAFCALLHANKEKKTPLSPQLTFRCHPPRVHNDADDSGIPEVIRIPCVTTRNKSHHLSICNRSKDYSCTQVITSSIADRIIAGAIRWGFFASLPNTCIGIGLVDEYKMEKLPKSSAALVNRAWVTANLLYGEMHSANPCPFISSDWSTLYFYLDVVTDGRLQRVIDITESVCGPLDTFVVSERSLAMILSAYPANFISLAEFSWTHHVQNSFLLLPESMKRCISKSSGVGDWPNDVGCGSHMVNMTGKGGPLRFVVMCRRPLDVFICVYNKCYLNTQLNSTNKIKDVAEAIYLICACNDTECYEWILEAIKERNDTADLVKYLKCILTYKVYKMTEECTDRFVSFISELESHSENLL